MDTDVLVDILRGHQPALDWLSALGSEEIGVSGISMMELLAGATNLDDARRIEATLGGVAVYWPDTDSCDYLLREFSQLRLRDGLGVADALIAATAMGLDTPLRTGNLRHFRGVPRLTVEVPYEK